MQTRPSTVRIRKGCIRRRTLRCGCLFLFLLPLWLCFHISLLSAIVLSFISIVCFEWFLFRRW